MNLKHLNVLLLLAALPPAGRAATLYYGTGSSAVWDTATANWGTVTGGPYTTVNDGVYHDAVFEGTGKTVAVSTVNANSMSLLSNGYTLSAGTITLGSPAGGPAVNVSTGVSASISSVWDRAGGGAALRKTGAGTLTYTGLSVINGYNITVEGGTLAVGTGGRLWHDTAYQSGSVLTVASGATLDLKTWGYGTGHSLGALRANNNAIVISGGTIRMSGGATNYNRGMTINAGVTTFEAATGADWTLASAIANVYSGNPSLIFTGAGTGDFQKGFSGSGTLTKSGAGTWTLSGGNSHTGNTTVSAGTLLVTGGIYRGGYQPFAVLTVNGGATLQLQDWTYNEGTGSLGGLRASANAIVINNGTIRVTGSTEYGRGVTIQAGGATFEAATGANWTHGGGDYAANVYTGNPSLTFTGAGNGTYDKVFSGSGLLTKSGTGNWVFSRSNTHTGNTTINAGTLTLGSGGTAGSLSTGSAITNNGTLAFNRTDTLTQGTDFANGISGSGGVTQAGTGTVFLSSAANSFSGPVNITAGTLKVSDVADVGFNSGLGTGAGASTVTVSNGATFEFNAAGTDSTNRAISLSVAHGTINVSAGTLNLTGTGGLRGGGPTASFHKSGAGTLVISGSESWDGNGFIHAGTLAIGANGGAPGSTSLDGGNWELNGSATLRINTSGEFASSAITRNGSSNVNLESGTLRTNTLSGTGTMTWGAATLTMLEERVGTASGPDRSVGAASGPVVREGTVINATGALTTSTGSLLDLGPMYSSGGYLYDRLAITGSLNLSAGGDTLNFEVNPSFLRPSSPNSVVTGDWGTLRLILADNVAGIFNTITGIGNDAIGWHELGSQVGDPTFTTAASLPLNTWHIEYVGSGYSEAGIQAGGAVLFHYKVAGSVPEPASAGLLIAGGLLLRALRRR